MSPARDNTGAPFAQLSRLFALQRFREKVYQLCKVDILFEQPNETRYLLAVAPRVKAKISLTHTHASSRAAQEACKGANAGKNCMYTPAPFSWHQFLET